MQFTKKLREGIRQGEITTSIRVWQSPRVKVNGRYPMERGHVVVTSIRQIEWGDISDSLARESGFRNLADLMQTARHGTGQKLYFVRFRYEAAGMDDSAEARDT